MDVILDIKSRVRELSLKLLTDWEKNNTQDAKFMVADISGLLATFGRECFADGLKAAFCLQPCECDSCERIRSKLLAMRENL